MIRTPLIERIRKIRPSIRPKLKYVQLRVSVAGKQYQFPTLVDKSKVDPNNMDVTEPPLHYYAQHLYGCFTRSETVDKARDAYKLAIGLGIDVKVNYETEDFNTICDKFIIDHQEKSDGYLRHFKTLQFVIKKFRPNQIITIQDITSTFVENFYLHLVGRGVVIGTIISYLKHLKVIVKYAKDELELKTSNPNFNKRLALKDNAHVIIALTKDELRRLEKVEISDWFDEMTHKTFLFMCYTGVRASDLEYAKIENLTGNILQLFLVKQKKIHKIRLIPKALVILNDLKKFGHLSNQKMNKRIKKLCERAEIDNQVTYYKSVGNKNLEELHSPKHELITLHCGRRTFATLAKEYVNDISIVSKMLGHKDTRTTMRYIGDTESDYTKLDGLFSD